MSEAPPDVLRNAHVGSGEGEHSAKWRPGGIGGASAACKGEPCKEEPDTDACKVGAAKRGPKPVCAAAQKAALTAGLFQESGAPMDGLSKAHEYAARRSSACRCSHCPRALLSGAARTAG